MLNYYGDQEFLISFYLNFSTIRKECVFTIFSFYFWMRYLLKFLVKSLMNFSFLETMGVIDFGNVLLVPWLEIRPSSRSVWSKTSWVASLVIYPFQGVLLLSDLRKQEVPKFWFSPTEMNPRAGIFVPALINKSCIQQLQLLIVKS